MPETVLEGRGGLVLLTLDENARLTLKKENGTRQTLFPRPCRAFSADVDEKGNVHAACVTKDALSYIKLGEKKNETVHLMSLPDGFSVRTPYLRAKDGIRLYYAVRGKEGYAVIGYTREGNGWTGCRLTSGTDEMAVALADAHGCFVTVSKKDGDELVNAHTGETVFSSCLKIDRVSEKAGKLLVVSGGTVYFDGVAVGSGTEVYTAEDDAFLVRQGKRLVRFLCAGRVLNAGSEPVPENARPYELCRPGKEKAVLLAPPFPFPPVPRTGTAALEREVYRQQKAIFALEAAVRELRTRLKRLEDGDGIVITK